VRLDIAGQRQDHLVSPRIAAEVEIRRHIRCEVLASCGSQSARRIEGQNAKIRGSSRASRTRAAQVADIGDARNRPAEPLCLWLSGQGRGASGDCLPGDLACTLKNQLRDATRDQLDCAAAAGPTQPWTEPTL
jgi:hypothetical protein